jgi:hypothetical protein
LVPADEAAAVVATVAVPTVAAAAAAVPLPPTALLLFLTLLQLLLLLLLLPTAIRLTRSVMCAAAWHDDASPHKSLDAAAIFCLVCCKGLHKLFINLGRLFLGFLQTNAIMCRCLQSLQDFAG